MTALRFPAEIAVGEVWWQDAREPDGSGHLLAIGVVEVPDGTAVDLSVYTVAEVSVSGQPGGIFAVPAGTGSRTCPSSNTCRCSTGRTPSMACSSWPACRSCGTSISKEKA